VQGGGGVGGWSDILGRSFSRTENTIKSGIGQPRNFLICGQLEAHLGSPQGEVDLAIWQNR
jgi:hypothetical protein